MSAVVPDEHRQRVAFWALAAVALLISHDATFLVQVGPGEALAGALREAGHAYWGAASAVLLLIGLVAGARIGIRLFQLRRRASALAAQAPAVPRAAWLRRAAANWGRLTLIVAVGFVVQENIEHVLTHGHAPGLGALAGPESPLALPVIAAITLVAALVATAVRVAERRLVAGILAALRRPLGRAPRSVPRPAPRILVRLSSPIARAVAGRAPPSVLVAT
jgi:hypothetical protein